jgi:hypothetical protein
VPLDIDKEIDRLYGVAPSEFVAERRRIERTLRGEGRKGEADEVKALAKPTTAAWIVNQLVREKRRDVERLLAAGERLRKAQRAAVAGEGTKRFEEARGEENEARRALGDAAASLLAERGKQATQGVLDRVDQTLRAAAVLDEGRELLAAGRLVRELEAGGFELLAGVEPGKDKREAAERPAPAKRQERLGQARDDVKQARSRARDAADALRRAEREAKAARRALEAAEAAVDEALREAEAADAALEHAERDLAAAKRA